MPRGSISDADAVLIDALDSVGRQVSRFQLERWRSHGLLPPPTVLHEQFGGTSVAPHPDWVFNAALELADSSGRGSPWQWGGVWLFEEGLPLSETCLQECASWLVENVQGRIRGHWNAAAANCDASYTDPEDERMAIAEQVVDRLLHDRSLRPVVRSAKEAILAESPNVGRSELRDLLHRSLTYRVIDIVWPGGLSRREARVAISGREEPDPSLVPLLPSAIASCAATLTTAEATVALARQDAFEGAGGPTIRGLRIMRALVAVLEARVTRGTRNAATPIRADDLEDMLDDARILNEMAEEGVHVDQMDIFDVLEDQSSPTLHP
jgi:hypothetical protein